VPRAVAFAQLVVVVAGVAALSACPPKPEECDRNIEKPGAGEGEGEGEGDVGEGEPAPPPPQCFDDTDCQPDQFCDFNTGSCIFFDAECFTDSDCGRDNFCDNGKCVGGGFVCQSAADCGGDQLCDASGRCVNPSADDGTVRVKCFLASDGKYDCDCDDFASFRSLDFCILDDFKQTAIDECGL